MWKLRGRLICLQISLMTCAFKREMHTFREAKRVLLYPLYSFMYPFIYPYVCFYMVSDEEFAFLYDINTSKNRDLNIGFTMLLIYTKSQMIIVWQNSDVRKKHPQLSNSTSTSL